VNGSLNLHPKVAATLLATWITALIVYGLHQWAHTDLTAPAAVGLTGTVGFIAGWLAPNQVDSTPPAK